LPPKRALLIETFGLDDDATEADLDAAIMQGTVKQCRIGEHGEVAPPERS
jgi:hypothetical protein